MATRSAKAPTWIRSTPTPMGVVPAGPSAWAVPAVPNRIPAATTNRMEMRVPGMGSGYR
jgi:hypothetical protein